MKLECTTNTGEHPAHLCHACGCPLTLTRGAVKAWLEVIAKPGNLERLQRILAADAQWEAIFTDQPGGPRDV